MMPPVTQQISARLSLEHLKRNLRVDSNLMAGLERDSLELGPSGKGILKAAFWARETWTKAGHTLELALDTEVKVIHCFSIRLGSSFNFIVRSRAHSEL